MASSSPSSSSPPTSLMRRMAIISGFLLIAFIAALAAILPERWMSWLTGQSSRFLSGGGGLPERSAPMYGIMGALPNRGDLRELVLDLVEGFTEPES